MAAARRRLGARALDAGSRAARRRHPGRTRHRSATCAVRSSARTGARAIGVGRWRLWPLPWPTTLTSAGAVDVPRSVRADPARSPRSRCGSRSRSSRTHRRRPSPAPVLAPARTRRRRRRRSSTDHPRQPGTDARYAERTHRPDHPADRLRCRPADVWYLPIHACIANTIHCALGSVRMPPRLPVRDPDRPRRVDRPTRRAAPAAPGRHRRRPRAARRAASLRQDVPAARPRATPARRPAGTRSTSTSTASRRWSRSAPGIATAYGRLDDNRIRSHLAALGSRLGLSLEHVGRRRHVRPAHSTQPSHDVDPDGGRGAARPAAAAVRAGPGARRSWCSTSSRICSARAPPSTDCCARTCSTTARRPPTSMPARSHR